MVPSKVFNIGFVAAGIIALSTVSAYAADPATSSQDMSIGEVVHQLEDDAGRVGDKAAEAGSSAVDSAATAVDATTNEAEGAYNWAKQQGEQAYQWAKKKLQEVTQ